MRRLLTTAALLALTPITVALSASTAAAAPTECAVIDPMTGVCQVTIPVPGGSGAGDGGGSGSGSGGGATTPVYDPCAPENLPEVGACVGGAVGNLPPVLTPAQVARLAVAQFNIRAIDIGIVPEPDPDHTGLVGMPAWMWVDNPTASTWGPNSTTLTAGGITVTATARVARVEWNMGDGTTVTCTTQGTEFTDADGGRESPDCGHTYTRTSAGEPNDAYTVTATSFWVVTWAGGGASGTIPLQVSDSAQVRIGELQVIVTR